MIAPRTNLTPALRFRRSQGARLMALIAVFAATANMRIDAATEAFSSPRGVYTVKVAGKPESKSQARTYFGVQLLPDIRFFGNASSVSGDTLVLDGAVCIRHTRIRRGSATCMSYRGMVVDSSPTSRNSALMISGAPKISPLGCHQGRRCRSAPFESRGSARSRPLLWFGIRTRCSNSGQRCGLESGCRCRTGRLFSLDPSSLGRARSRGGCQSCDHEVSLWHLYHQEVGRFTQGFFVRKCRGGTGAASGAHGSQRVFPAGQPVGYAGELDFLKRRLFGRERFQLESGRPS
jgi:hypothetical protein